VKTSGKPRCKLIKTKQMKTKQTKIDRSGAKWLPGAMALAATTGGAQAASVQITLNGNKISTTGGNQLVADLTGDNLVDVKLDDELQISGVDNVLLGINGGLVFARQYFDPFRLVVGFSIDANFYYTFTGVGDAFENGVDVLSTVYLNPITFSDSRINGGATTSGWLEVNAFNTSYTDHTVQLTRLIFDDASTTRPVFAEIPGTQTEWAAVPEPSSLGLLALGAGGLALRRSRSRKAKAA
jgi:hypothetical protein